MTEEFTTKERKKVFDKIFKNTIVPFFEAKGFKQHTKTSKRLYKELANKLSVFIFFEYKTFGEGFYDITISYFDSDFGAVYDDEYLVMAQISTPTISGMNEQDLSASAAAWIKIIDLKIIPFITTHATHEALLNSNQFYISKSREKERIGLLERKLTCIKTYDWNSASFYYSRNFSKIRKDVFVDCWLQYYVSSRERKIRYRTCCNCI